MIRRVNAPAGSDRRRVAIVLAGGTGSRVGLETPKQLLKIAGRSVLAHTLAVFENHPGIDEVVLMMAVGHLDAARAIVREEGFTKVAHVLEGAETRNATTERALAAVPHDDCDVLVHDAVRPFLSTRIIDDCIAALRTYEAVDVAIPSADTIIQVEDDVIESIPDRARLRRGQTPQGFHIGTIRRAYALAAQDDGFAATDDCGVVLRYLPGVDIGVVRGEDRNMKITDPIDLHIADKLFQLANSELPQQQGEDDYREALEGKVVVVFGGSYGIGADIAAFAAKHGASVHSFSRSATGTRVEDRRDVAEAAAAVDRIEGRVDFVVNTAGVLPRGELVDASEETIHSSIEVNYFGPIFIAQQFFPLLQRTRGSLLLFTSSSYTRGRAGYSLYSSAKAAVVNLTQALADEWSPHHVRVNAINPERTGTPMRTQAFGAEPAGSLLESGEVARRSVDVLISGSTGQIFDVRKHDPFLG